MMNEITKTVLLWKSELLQSSKVIDSGIIKKMIVNRKSCNG